MSLRSGAGENYLEHIPWLLTMAQEGRNAEKREELYSLLVYVFLGISLLGGSIYFGFLRTRSRMPDGLS